MRYATYKEIPALLEWRVQFSGSSVTAIQEGKNIYNVYSYGTLILSARNGEVVYFDSGYYSRTTSRLQNILRQVFNIK